MKYCTNCGKELPDDAKFCYGCGMSTHAAEEDLVCPNCGEVNEKGTKYCRSCTYPLGTAAQGITIVAPDGAGVTISDAPPQPRRETGYIGAAAGAAVKAVRELLRETQASETPGETVINSWQE